MTENQTQNTNQRFHGLDHLRTLAILLVFFFHYIILSRGQPEWLADLASFGWTGVDLFFVLSGFLISSQLFSEIKRGRIISFRLFFVKRFFRIIPAFLVTLGLYFCFPFFREKEALPALWKFLTFTQNLGLNLKDFGTFSHAWSLCVEEHFYLVLPLLLMSLQNSKLFSWSYWILIVLFLSGLALRIYSFNYVYLPVINDENSWVNWYKFIYYPSYTRLDGLLTGVSIAGLYTFRPKFWEKLAKYGNLFIVLSLCVLSGAYFLCEDPQTYSASVYGFPLVALGYGCLLTGAISPGSFLYKWNSKGTAFIAGLSYSIYLTHKGVIHVTHLLLKEFELNSHTLLIICLFSCTLFAYLLHRAIEKPFMAMRNKIVSGLL